MRKKIYTIIATFATVIVIQSCNITKQYATPADVISDNYYRTDQLPADSVSMAEISWRQLFTDPVLQRHIDTALVNNIDIRVALENIRISEAYVRQARAAFLPTFNVAPGISYQNNSLNSQVGALLGERQWVSQYDLSATASWEADIWGKLKSGKKLMVAQYLQSVAAHQAVKSELVAAIASTYYRLLALDEQKRIINETISYREKSLSTTRALKASGALTEVAVQQNEAQLLNARAQLIDVESSIKILENEVCLLKGEPSHSIERSSFAAQTVHDELNLGYPVSLLRNRPDVAAAEYNLVSAYEQTNIARAALYPSLRINASAGLQSIDIDKLFDPTSLFASIAGSLTQPILNQRRLKTEVEVSKAAQETARLRFKETLLVAGKEVSDALQAFDAQTRIMDLKRQEYVAYNKAIEYSTELVNYGLANYLEVLRAEENALNAQLSQVNAGLGRLNAMVELYRALGGGWR